MALVLCPECKREVSDRAIACPNCGYPMHEELSIESEDIQEYCGFQENKNDSFDGIYRMVGWGKQEKVYCPVCNSSNCSWYTREKVIPGKTKTKYTVNLNPLKPFTLVNKKEKVVRKEKVIEQKRIICNSCGYTFF